MKFNKIEKFPVSDADERLDDLQTAKEEWHEILVTSDDPTKVAGYNYINALEERIKQLEKHINDVHIRPEVI